MASLSDVWHAIFPSARPVASLSRSGLDRDVAWVRLLKARVPAFDGLEAGDLAIVPGSTLAAVGSRLPEPAALAAELQHLDVAGVLLVDTPGAAGGPAQALTAAPAPAPGIQPGGNGSAAAGVVALDALALAAATAGLPALRLPAGDPVQLERSVIGYLLNWRAELDRQAERLEIALERVALEGGGLEALVATVAAFLGRAVALEGRQGNALAIHAPSDIPSAVGAVAGYLARPRAAALRVPLPAAPQVEGGSTGRAGSEPPPAGRLALLGDAPPTDLERVATARVAGLLALELAREMAVRRARDSARQSDPLPPDGPPWVVLVARQPGLRDGVSTEQREETRREVRLIASPRRLMLRGDADSVELRVVVAAAADDPGGLDLVAKVAARLGRPVAVSQPFREPGDRAVAEAEARATLEAAERLSDVPPVVRADRLPAYRLLGSLHNLPEAPAQARAILAPLLVGRPTAQRERLATLRAVLEQPGLAEAAAVLGVHRNTLAYRVRRIEQLTGWQLVDPELRLPLALAVRIVQNDQ